MFRPNVRQGLSAADRGLTFRRYISKRSLHKVNEYYPKSERHALLAKMWR